MFTLPILTTERLVLRPLRDRDAPAFCALSRDPKIAATMYHVPPSEEDAVLRYIASLPLQFYENRGVTLAITLRESGELIGCVSIAYVHEDRSGEMSSWVGVPHWNKRYTSEALAAMVTYAFEERGYHKIIAHRMESNPAPGKLLARLGFSHEGTLVDRIYKDGKFHTALVYGLINPKDT